MISYAGWQAYTESSTEVLDPGPVAALAALFDDGLPAPAPGDPLPPLWHWVALPRWSPSHILDTDGHPRRGDFLPPIRLPRRMFAGGEVQLPGRLLVGQSLRREAAVIAVSEKQGRSGALVIVDVRIRLYHLDGDLAVEEVQHLVYREAAAGGGRSAEPPGAAAPHPGAPLYQINDDEWELRTDASLLMRFSAATANAHRIHYDWPYATQVEGYPGVVVHGPLQTLALAEIHRLTGGAAVGALSHRGHVPLFCGDPARVRRTVRDDGLQIELFGGRAQSAGPHATLRLVTVPTGLPDRRPGG